MSDIPTKFCLMRKNRAILDMRRHHAEEVALAEQRRASPSRFGEPQALFPNPFAVPETRP